ncbi:MAG: hypothetical protein V3T86_13710 [Planctomycetota bacterium]
MTTRLSIFGAAGIALLCYLPSLRGEFLYDDARFVVNNPHIDTVGNPARFFTDIETTAAPDRATRDIYRPLRTLSYALLKSVGADPDPGVFHLLNVLLHAVSVALLAALLLNAGVGAGPAFFSALLFGVHPLTVEVTAYISSLGDSWATAFGLASIYMHARQRPVGAFVFFTAALFGKESMVVVPILWGVWDWALRRAPIAKTAVRSVLPGLLIVVAFMFWRDSLGAKSAQTVFLGGSRLTAVWTMLSALGYYAALVLFPAGPTFEAIVDPQPTPWSVPVLVGVAVLGLLVWAIWRGAPRVRLAAAWFLVGLAPVSNVIVPLKIAAADRFVYLSLAGLAFLVGDTLQRPTTTPYVRRAGWAVLLLLALVTQDRIADWRSPQTLRDARRQVWPKNERVVWGDAAAEAAKAVDIYAVARGPSDLERASEALQKATDFYDVFFRNSPVEVTLQARIELARLYLEAASAHARLGFDNHAQILYEDTLRQLREAHRLHLNGVGRYNANEAAFVADAILHVCVQLAVPGYQKVELLASVGARAAIVLEKNFGRREDFRRSILLMATAIQRRVSHKAESRAAFQKCLHVFEKLEEGGQDTRYHRGLCYMYLAVIKDRPPNREYLEMARGLFLEVATQDESYWAWGHMHRARCLRLIGLLFDDIESAKRAYAILQELKPKVVGERLVRDIRSELSLCEKLLNK